MAGQKPSEIVEQALKGFTSPKEITLQKGFSQYLLKHVNDTEKDYGAYWTLTKYPNRRFRLNWFSCGDLVVFDRVTGEYAVVGNTRNPDDVMGGYFQALDANMTLDKFLNPRTNKMNGNGNNSNIKHGSYMTSRKDEELEIQYFNDEIQRNPRWKGIVLDDVTYTNGNMIIHFSGPAQTVDYVLDYMGFKEGIPRGERKPITTFPTTLSTHEIDKLVAPIWNNPQKYGLPIDYQAKLIRMIPGATQEDEQAEMLEYDEELPDFIKKNIRMALYNEWKRINKRRTSGRTNSAFKEAMWESRREKSEQQDEVNYEDTVGR